MVQEPGSLGDNPACALFRVAISGRDGHGWPTRFSDLSSYAAGAYGRSRGEMATRPQYLGGALNVGRVPETEKARVTLI
jgi:hypothetical protein